MLKSVFSEGGLKALAYDVGPGRYYQPAYRNIASAIDVESGAFLDVGCGPGWLSIYVAAGKPELDAIGIDTSEAMLQVADRHKGTRLNVTYRTMDAADIIYGQTNGENSCGAQGGPLGPGGTPQTPQRVSPCRPRLQQLT